MSSAMRMLTRSAISSGGGPFEVVVVGGGVLGGGGGGEGILAFVEGCRRFAITSKSADVEGIISGVFEFVVGVGGRGFLQHFPILLGLLKSQ